MAGRSLGVLTLDLIARVGGFVSGMNQAERVANTKLRAIEKRAQAFGRTLGTVFGVSLAGAITGSIAAIGQAIDRMDELRDASIRLGVGVETLSAYRYAAQQTGTDIEALSKGLKILAKNAADAVEVGEGRNIFKALNIEVLDTAGNLKQLDALIPDIADRFAALQDGTQKAALAQELFGKSGLDLIEFLNQGSQGLSDMTDRAKELGLVFGQDAADQADLFNDTVQEAKDAVAGLAQGVAIELLPTLIELVAEFRDFASDGDNAKVIAENLAGVLKGLAEIAGGVVGIFEILGATLRGVYADLQALDQLGDATQKAFRLDIEGARESVRLAKQFRAEAAAASGEIQDVLDRADPAKRRQGPIPITPVDSLFQVPGAPNRFSAVPTVTTDFSGRVPKGSGVNDKALARALAGITDKPKKSGGGKSDAQKDAEALAKAINQMTDAQREWQAELDGTGNKITDEYAKRLAEITEKAEDFTRDGIPAAKVAEFRTEMEALALAIKDKETAAYLEEFANETAKMVAGAEGVSTATLEYADAMKALNKELAEGLISQSLYEERSVALAKVRDQNAMQVLSDIQSQRDQLGLTAEQQDTYNKLIYAGVDANSALGQAIIEANHELFAQMEATSLQVEAMDALRDTARGFFSDLKDGLEEGKSAWDILKDSVDSFADALYDIIINNLVKKALGEDGSTSGGSGGGWISSLFGSLFGAGGSGGSSAGGSDFMSAFGGSYAIGGYARPGGIYEVNERQPELLSMKGKTFLMMGADGGMVSSGPVDNSRRGDVNLSIIQNFASPTESKTATQAAKDAAVENQRMLARNGK